MQIPSTDIQSQAWQWVPIVPALGGGIPGAYWPASTANL